MNVIKRSGKEVEFDPSKIEAAIERANNSIETKSKRIGKRLIKLITDEISESYINSKRTRNVEYIQDQIENKLIEYNAYAVAKEYITYRYKRTLARTSNTTDDKIMSLIEYNNEEVKQENSNKNPIIASTQRDYIAGEVSKDITNRILLSDDIVEAHNEGLIHFHDADYFAQHIFNCCLINLEDMLQNGTVISGTLIEKPHSFSTACNIATQIIAQVASNQYGGQTITLSHLAPFVEVSRQKIRNEVEEELQALDTFSRNLLVDEIVEKRVKEEIKKGIQTIQYQVVTLMTTNG
jgi:ribonucleoside-triphosphate reductase